MFVEALSQDFGDLAIGSPQIVFRAEIGDPHRFHVREPVIGPDDNDEPFAKERQVMQMRLARLVGSRKDRRLQFPCPKPAIEFFRRGVRDLEVHSRMAGADPDQQPDEIARRDGAHDAELQPRLRQLLDIERSPARRLRFVQDLVEVGLYDLSQFGKMR